VNTFGKIGFGKEGPHDLYTEHRGLPSQPPSGLSGLFG
jgi:hypothetical protein